MAEFVVYFEGSVGVTARDEESAKEKASRLVSRGGENVSNFEIVNVDEE